MRISILIGNRDLERGSDLEKGAAEKGKTFLSLPSQLNSKGQQNQMDGVHTHVFLHHSNLEQKKRRILLTKEKCVCMYISTSVTSRCHFHRGTRITIRLSIREK
jgi:hypothetical protein